MSTFQKWCLNTSKPVKTLRKARLDVAVGPSEIKDSHLVVLTSQNISVGTFKWFLHSYNLNTESESSSFELESRPTCCSFSENGQRLAIGFENGNVQVRRIFVQVQLIYKANFQAFSFFGKPSSLNMNLFYQPFFKYQA